MEARDHKNRMCQRKHQQRRIVLAGVCVHHTGYSDVHIEKMHTCVETEKHTTIIAGGFNAQLGLGEGSESDYVGKHALGESNKRGAWMKQWLMIPNCVALNTKFKTRTRNGRTVSVRVLDARCMRRQPKQAKLKCWRNEPTNFHEDKLNLRTGSQNKHAAAAPFAKKKNQLSTSRQQQNKRR